LSAEATQGVTPMLAQHSKVTLVFKEPAGGGPPTARGAGERSLEHPSRAVLGRRIIGLLEEASTGVQRKPDAPRQTEGNSL